MQVILKQDVPNLGHANEMVTVKSGYARNYLVPKGLAIVATESARKMHEENLRQRAHKELKVKSLAQELVNKIERVKLKIGAKTSSTGKIFGSVNTIQIAEALESKGFAIDRRNISLYEDTIKDIGSYKAKIKLHKEVSVEIDFEIVSE